MFPQLVFLQVMLKVTLKKPFLVAFCWLVVGVTMVMVIWGVAYITVRLLLLNAALFALSSAR